MRPRVRWALKDKRSPVSYFIEQHPRGWPLNWAKFAYVRTEAMRFASIDAARTTRQAVVKTWDPGLSKHLVVVRLTRKLVLR